MLRLPVLRLLLRPRLPVQVPAPPHPGSRSEANFTINTSGESLFDVRGLEDEEAVPDRKEVLLTKCEDSNKVN